MAQLIVRNLEDGVRDRLAAMAREHGRSMEEEVREILRRAASIPEQPQEGLGARMSRIFAEHGLDFEIPELRHGEMGNYVPDVP